MQQVDDVDMLKRLHIPARLTNTPTQSVRARLVGKPVPTFGDVLGIADQND